jgi:hypothetical protein
MHIRQILSRYVRGVQGILFPILEEKMGSLSETQRQMIQILELLGLERHVAVCRGGRGRPAKDRIALARAFVAKMVYNLPTTKDLVERLGSDPTLCRICGLGKAVPSEATFSRAFAEFAERGLAESAHEALIGKYQAGRLVGHISRDSTAIAGREEPVIKAKPAKSKRKRGRPRRGEEVPHEVRRLEVQPTRTLEENLKDLPQTCGIGTKLNSKGHTQHWIGYKLHLDVADGQIPISAILTSASVHDSQVAIPLAQMTAQRVDNCYDLMDAAYDAKPIRAFSRQLGHVPIIDFNRRRPADPREFSPCEARRFKERTTVERVYGRLKDEFGGRLIRVRGAKKVMEHLMFGLLALTADQLLRLVT